MAGNHPDNAAYVSADGKVSFDRYGRKLDSIGNVVAGDRQRAGDAGASPIQRREEPKPQPQAAGTSAWTVGPGGPMTPVQRSAWDKSIVQPAVGSASVAGVSGAGRGNNPNVLAPGGIDPATGRPYPTALNGDLQVSAPSGGSRWRQPWMGQQGPTVTQRAPGEIQMQTGGLNMGQSWRGTTPNANMPYPPTGGTFRNVYTPQLYTGAGQTPQGRVTPVFDNYTPETYTQPSVPVYDPRQLSWLVP